MRPTLVSVREFARRVKISDTAVHKMFASGQLPEDCKVIPKNGKTYKLDLYKTIAAFNAVGGAPHSDEYEGSKRSNRDALPSEPEAAPRSNIQKAKEAKIVLEAQLLKLKYEQESGKLVAKEDVYRALFGFGKELRETAMAIPDRITADLVAANSDSGLIHAILSAAIAEFLETMADIETRKIA